MNKGTPADPLREAREAFRLLRDAGWILDDLNAKVEAAFAALATKPAETAAPDQAGWIPVTERLPGSGDTFIVHTRPNGDVTHWKAVQPPAPEPRFTIEQVHQAMLDANVLYDREREEVLALLGAGPSIAQRGAPITFDDIRSGAWRPGGNGRVDAQRGAALTDEQIMNLAAGFVAEDWEPHYYYRDLNVVEFVRAALALSPERPE